MNPKEFSVSLDVVNPGDAFVVRYENEALVYIMVIAKKKLEDPYLPQANWLLTCLEIADTKSIVSPMHVVQFPASNELMHIVKFTPLQTMLAT